MCFCGVREVRTKWFDGLGVPGSQGATKGARKGIVGGPLAVAGVIWESSRDVCWPPCWSSNVFVLRNGKVLNVEEAEI